MRIVWDGGGVLDSPIFGSVNGNSVPSLLLHVRIPPCWGLSMKKWAHSAGYLKGNESEAPKVNSLVVAGLGSRFGSS
jgi:hypothetical protein